MSKLMGFFYPEIVKILKFDSSGTSYIAGEDAW